MIINISIYDDDQPFYLLLSFMINHDPSWLILDNLQNGSFWLGESVQSLMANVAGSAEDVLRHVIRSVGICRT